MDNSVKNKENDKAFLAFLEIYPKKSKDLPNIRPIWNELMAAGVYPADLKHAALKYTEWKLQLKKGSKYYKLPQNFLSDGFWLKYIPVALKECPECHGSRYLECLDDEGNPAVTECSCNHRYDDLRRRYEEECRLIFL